MLRNHALVQLEFQEDQESDALLVEEFPEPL
jgi:hypothetical protein